MQVFGVIDKNGGNSTNDNDYIKAGWNTDATATQRIISFDASVDTTPVNDPNIPSAQIGKRDLFEREFRKIASTSVGRVLLYRILIEIRRHNHNNSIGEQEQILANLKRRQNLERNKQRSISIVWANDFSYTQDKSGIYISNRLTKLTCIGHISEKQKITYIVPVYDTIDISLMHEMLHWWHVLRNIKRTQEERDNRNPENGSYNYHNISNYYFSQYYWNGLNWLSKWNGNEASILPWHFNGEYINFEEMRTILGFSCTDSSKHYLQGDDLSEDLYRVCVGKPLRFGYGHQGFYEDNIVIYRVINTNFTNYIYYCGSTNLIKRRKHARIPGDNSIPEVVNFNYDDKDGIDGLGKFKCLPRELWLPVE